MTQPPAINEPVNSGDRTGHDGTGSAVPVVTSFHMETSAGGIPITLCSCGLLIYQPMARIHMETCVTYQRCLRAGSLR